MPGQHRIQVWIDRDLCKGSGPCFTVAPKAFALDDAMRAVVLDPSAEPAESILEAARECPTAAIYLSLDGQALDP
jgi:ferredoxin